MFRSSNLNRRRRSSSTPLDAIALPCYKSDMQPIHGLTNPFGGSIWYKEATTSTMDDARELWNRDSSSVGSLVVTGYQSQGRGRFADRKWEVLSNEALMFTIVVPNDRPAPLSLTIALGLSRFLETFKLSVAVKWPNDVLVEGQKIAGILTLVERDTAFIGLGLNVKQRSFPPDGFRRPPTSLALQGLDLEPLDLLETLLGDLHWAWCLSGTEVIHAVEDRLFRRGEVIEIDSGVAGPDRKAIGQVLGLSPDGALRLGTPSGERIIYSGE